MFISYLHSSSFSNTPCCPVSYRGLYKVFAPRRAMNVNADGILETFINTHFQNVLNSKVVLKLCSCNEIWINFFLHIFSKATDSCEGATVLVDVFLNWNRKESPPHSWLWYKRFIINLMVRIKLVKKTVCVSTWFVQISWKCVMFLCRSGWRNRQLWEDSLWTLMIDDGHPLKTAAGPVLKSCIISVSAGNWACADKLSTSTTVLKMLFDCPQLILKLLCIDSAISPQPPV